MAAQRPESIRESILQTALAHFEARGYAAVALRDIAEELGTTKAAIYYHFRTKQSIVEALVADSRKEREAVFARLDAEPDLPLRELLCDYLKVYIHNQRVMTWLTNDMTAEIERSTHAAGRRRLRDELRRRMGGKPGREGALKASSAVLLLHTPVWTRYVEGDEDILLDIISGLLGESHAGCKAAKA